MKARPAPDAGLRRAGSPAQGFSHLIRKHRHAFLSSSSSPARDRRVVGRARLVRDRRLQEAQGVVEDDRRR